MSELIIIRGLPGSGKSTYAQKFIEQGYCHIEADQFFMVGEKYCYNASKIKEAHSFCKKQFVESVKMGKDVVVSNTFTRFSEIEFYLNFAKDHDYDVKIISLKGSFGSIHGVPEGTLQKMKHRWERVDGEKILYEY